MARTHHKLLQQFALLVNYCFALMACEHSPVGCMETVGVTVQESRQVNTFNKVKLNDIFNVILHQSDSCYLLLEGKDHLLPDLQTTVNNNTLVVADDSPCKWLRSYAHLTDVHIYCPRYDTVEVHGQCTISTPDTLHQDFFRMDVHAAIADVSLLLDCNTLRFLVRGISGSTGNYTLKGRAGYSSIYNHGAAYLYADELKTETTLIRALSTGNSYVNASKSLGVSIEAQGDVIYSGSPEVDIFKRISSGQVIRKEEKKACPMWTSPWY